MKSSRDTFYEDTILNALMDEIYEDREDQFPGVTSLIYCITKTYWEQKHGKAEPDRTTKLYFSIGLGLERALLKEQKLTGELSGEHEGIFYHIDGLAVDEVVELKSTRISNRTKIDKSITKRVDGNYRDVDFIDMPESWIRQIMAYCKVKNTLKAKLVVIHVIQPDIRVWDVEFTQKEIDTNWEWLQKRRQVLWLGLENNRPPTPFEYNMDWECEKCPWALLCGVESKNA